MSREAERARIVEAHARREGPPFARRVFVLDRLELLGLEGEPLVARLEQRNRAVARRLGARIAAGRFTQSGLRRALERVSSPGARGYDALDLLTAGLLDAGGPGDPRAPLEPEMVFYQPTPARAVLQLLAQASLGPDDVLYDLGAGLGQVVLLAALLSGARAVGIEYEPAYAEYAARVARGLRLARAHFVHGDARTAPLSDGTIYFLYTPFRGAMLRAVLNRLQAEAARRPIRVASLGPCTLELAGEAWLRSIGEGPLDPGVPAIFRSVGRPADLCAAS